MPNVINANGLTVNTQEEDVAKLTAAYRSIYGNDINLDSGSPDAQMMMIYIQMNQDKLDLIKNVNASFDPDQATGRILDVRVAINGIQRQAGTYTITPVTITTTQAVVLYGLDDQATQDVFTVQDESGYQWQLMETVNLPISGTHVLNFRASTPGANYTLPGTIKFPVTIVLGVATINNPTTYTTLGINEESDAKLKIRRQKSVSLASQGYLAGLYAALRNINGIEVQIYENKDDIPNGDGQPGHSIWVIVSGTADPADIANAIYKKRNGGCNMFGDESYTIIQLDGSPFVVNWDMATTEDLFIEFEVTSLDGLVQPNIEGIRNQLPTLLSAGVYEKININDIATLVQQIDPNALVTNCGLGLTDTGPFYSSILPSSKKSQFLISSANVIITPMQIRPTAITIETEDTRQFLAFGGFGTYTWTLEQNDSGGTISPIGFYESGPVGAVTDIVKATDEHGNSVTATIQVI